MAKKLKALNAILEKLGGETTETSTADALNAIEGVITTSGNDIVFASATSGSTKKFKLEIVDAGTISAVEVE